VDAVWRGQTDASVPGLLLSAGLLWCGISYVWVAAGCGPEWNIPNRMKPPSGVHPLGTDHFGRDIPVMIMVGARTFDCRWRWGWVESAWSGCALGLAAAAARGICWTR